MSDSIFTKIINGEIPSHKIYEDDKTLAFLDIHPLNPGHALVVPKQQVDKLYELDDEMYQAVMSTSKKVAAQLDAVLKQRVSYRVVGVDVPHAHMHLIPFSETTELKKTQDMEAEPDHEALAALAKRLRLE